MPYVKRAQTGEILSMHRDAVSGAEPLPANHPEVSAFLERDAKDSAFATMDAGLIRVIEDLVDALIKRNVLCVTDLPVEAQQKLFTRRNFRDRFRGNALNLFGDYVPEQRAEGAKPGHSANPGASAIKTKREQAAPLPNSLRLL